MSKKVKLRYSKKLENLYNSYYNKEAKENECKSCGHQQDPNDRIYSILDDFINAADVAFYNWGSSTPRFDVFMRGFDFVQSLKPGEKAYYFCPVNSEFTILVYKSRSTDEIVRKIVKSIDAKEGCK
jgi:hypothetical protein